MKRSAIPIEEYRGYEIAYDEEKDKFYCPVDNDKWDNKERKSLTAMKYAIDGHLKQNENFVPFVVIEARRYHGTPDKLTILSRTKDGKFVYENEEGKKKSIDDYYFKDWLIYDEADEPVLRAMEIIDNQIEKLQEEFKAKIAMLVSKPLSTYNK